ncbi:hypothetical protein ABIB66_007787 [Bradyrhizobium sp. F1.13.3]
MRHPWIAVALLAVGVIAWAMVAERPPEPPLRIEVSLTVAADHDVRLISERSPFMRTER